MTSVPSVRTSSSPHCSIEVATRTQGSNQGDVPGRIMLAGSTHGTHRNELLSSWRIPRCRSLVLRSRLNSRSGRRQDEHAIIGRQDARHAKRSPFVG